MPPRSSVFHLHVPALRAHPGTPADDLQIKPSQLSTTTTTALDAEEADAEAALGYHRVTSRRGTIAFLNPTKANIQLDSKHNVEWYSRDHRKGRHPLQPGERRKITTFLRIEYWNISWWVAFLFTLGSTVWTINGFFVFLPSLNVMGTNNYVLGWTAFVGGTIFELGSYFMVMESLNRQQVVCFGHACHGLYTQCTHGFHRREKLIAEEGIEPQQWIWWGSRWHEIGFLASSIQLFAASVFWIATITGIPGVINMNNIALTNGIFWVPQVIGGTGFVVSRYLAPANAFYDWSLLFMLETQDGWYRIRPFRSLGWHVGFWNLVGSVGFTICGAFGIASGQSWAAFQSGCSTFWGSWAFLIGSVAQWIECLNH